MSLAIVRFCYYPGRTSDLTRYPPAVGVLKGPQNRNAENRKAYEYSAPTFTREGPHFRHQHEGAKQQCTMRFTQR